MQLAWDESKRQATRADRGLDFADAVVEVGRHTQKRWRATHDMHGLFLGRWMVVGYVQRGDSRHIFSMRKANEREQVRFG